jgi:hypothetical protein
VSMVSANANAINATTTGTAATGTILIDSTAGSVNTAGAASVGLFARSFAAANGGLITVHAGQVTTTGTGAAHAIQSQSTSGAITVTAAGNLSTTGNGAAGVFASGKGLINVTTANINTAGTNAF